MKTPNCKILAIIPARGGSKGIPYKNIKPLNGVPLLEYAVIEAEKSKYIDRLVVSTEDSKIAAVAEHRGVEVIKRPLELAEDSTRMEPVLQQVLDYLKNNDNYRPDIVLLLQPTSPLRLVEHIDSAVEKFLDNDFDTLLSVEFIFEHRYELIDDLYLEPVNTDRNNRQQRKPVVIENGAIYLIRANLVEEGKIFGEKLGYFVMDKQSSIDIDNDIDFIIAENIFKNKFVL
jgi:CMP-N-acetylneuraminic acid synthetase